MRKSKETFFETCADAVIRSRALGYYASLEEESHIKALLDRYSSDQTTARDYLLKEHYLFRDEFDHFGTARQRYFHKQITYLIDGDISLWRDSSKPMDAEHTLFENNSKLALLHSLCQETPIAEHPITCGNPPDMFAEQRIYISRRQACAYTFVVEKEKAYAILEDIIALMENIMAMPDRSELCCTSPALDILTVTVRITVSWGTENHCGIRLRMTNLKCAQKFFLKVSSSILQPLIMLVGGALRLYAKKNDLQIRFSVLKK